MKLFHRPFVQVLLILLAVLIFAAIMTQYFPLPPEFLCMEYPDVAGCEEVRQSFPDLGPPDLFECILIAWMVVALLPATSPALLRQVVQDCLPLLPRQVGVT